LERWRHSIKAELAELAALPGRIVEARDACAERRGRFTGLTNGG
jgi:hypothetical protein